MNWFQELQLNEYYSIYIKNGAIATGTLSIIQDDYIVLLNRLNNKIIVSNLSDIVMIEQLSTIDELNQKSSKVVEEVSQIVKQKKTEKHNKKIKELYSEKRDIERQIIEERLKEHAVSSFNKVNYGIPNFFKKQSTE